MSEKEIPSISIGKMLASGIGLPPMWLFAKIMPKVRIIGVDLSSKPDQTGIHYVTQYVEKIKHESNNSRKMRGLPLRRRRGLRGSRRSKWGRWGR